MLACRELLEKRKNEIEFQAFICKIFSNKVKYLLNCDINIYISHAIDLLFAEQHVSSVSYVIINQIFIRSNSCEICVRAPYYWNRNKAKLNNKYSPVIIVYA